MFRQLRCLSGLPLKRLTTTMLHSRPACLTFSLLLGLSLVSLLMLSMADTVARPQHPTSAQAGGSDRAVVSAAPWTVFTPTYVLSPNLLINPEFEDDPPGSGWWCASSGCAVDETVAHSGTRSLKLVNDVSTGNQDASQVIVLNQKTPRPLYFGGWSRAECVTGGADNNYSVYLDVRYADDTWLYGQVLQFDPCSHDWQFREGIIVPAKPIWAVYVHSLLRWTHQGTVWFDDLSVQEVLTEIVFDSVPVTTSRPSPSPYGGAVLSLTTAGTLDLRLTADGGAVTSVTLNGQDVQDSERAYASGFFVRDVASQSDFVHVGGSLTKAGKTIFHTSSITDLDLDFSATYTESADRITIHAKVTGLTDTHASTRSLTLYFALPISAAGWTWGDDVRNSRTISGVFEYASFSQEHRGIGANSNLSKYPWASLTGPQGGIALGVSLDSPSVMRLVHNPATNQYYAAFDLGLSPHTDKFPNQAWADLVLYAFTDTWRYDDDWGFRAAAQGYYDRFPLAFTRTITPEREGIWVAFSDICNITDVLDFGIAFHELDDLSQVPCDDKHGIFSFRYLAEPWSAWMPISRRPLFNPGFEEDNEPPPGDADGWENGFFIGSDYYTYTIDENGGCCGSQAIKLVNDATLTDIHGGGRQITPLNQLEPLSLYVSGWSKAENVTGDPNFPEDYSVWLDVDYTGNSWLYKQVITFATGTHDWQFGENFIIPAKTIEAVNVHSLLRKSYSGTAWFDDIDLWEIASERKEVTATISSGFFDECGRHRYESTVQPWCSGPEGCSVFTVNPDPGISNTLHMLDKAHLAWNQGTKNTYITSPTLDGEYIDSFLSHATVMDYRTEHFPAADIPLTYGTYDRRVGVPEIFATVEFARWLSQELNTVPGQQWMMANWILRDLPWGADLFDVMGTEVPDWLRDSQLVPESDPILSYRRTLAYQRPYLLLMNTDFDDLTPELVEQYFQVALFYGFYPSMFSQDAATNPYWEDPALYNRDRDLFKRYIPLIRMLNVAGWEPVTYATTDKEGVYIERFGNWPDLHFTLRNTTDVTTTVTIRLWQDALGLPDVPLCVSSRLVATHQSLSPPGDIRTVTVILEPHASEILNFDCLVYIPIISRSR